MHDGVGLIFERQIPPKKSTLPFHTQRRRKMTINHYKASNRRRKWLDNHCHHRQAGQSNQQSTSIWRYLGSCETRLCKFHCRSCSTRGAIVLESFACQRCTTNQPDGTIHGSIVSPTRKVADREERHMAWRLVTVHRLAVMLV